MTYIETLDIFMTNEIVKLEYEVDGIKRQLADCEKLVESRGLEIAVHGKRIDTLALDNNDLRSYILELRGKLERIEVDSFL